MRYLTIIIAFILLDSCSNVGQVDVDSIRIVKLNQHPALIDHDRKLITVDKNKRVIDELAIYPDAGSGCESFLFNSGSKYILIDCNGQWFSIEKSTGTLKNEGWKWNEQLPDHPLGKFHTSNIAPNYIYTPETNFKMNEVYKYKDPND